MERELILRDESLWQRIVRTLTDYSPLTSKTVESNNTTEKF